MCYSHHISPGCPKRCTTLISQPANMPRINVVATDWVQQAVAFSIKCPKATIPQCMLACGFSKVESNDRAQRMAIYCHLKKVGQPHDDTNEYVTPPTLAVDVPVLNDSALSSVTVSLLSNISVPPSQKESSIDRKPATSCINREKDDT